MSFRISLAYITFLRSSGLDVHLMDDWGGDSSSLTPAFFYPPPPPPDLKKKKRYDPCALGNTGTGILQ